MRLIEEITVEVPDHVTYLDYLTLDPTAVEGKIVLKAKSPIFAKWMASLVPEGTKPSTSGKWGGSYHNIEYGRINGLGEIWMDAVGQDALIRTTPHGASINLSWLRHTKLGEGIEIAFSPTISMADYEDFLPTAAQTLKRLYLNNIRQEILTLRMREDF